MNTGKGHRGGLTKEGMVMIRTWLDMFTLGYTAYYQVIPLQGYTSTDVVVTLNQKTRSNLEGMGHGHIMIPSIIV
jgi:hypothetical protein